MFLLAASDKCVDVSRPEHFDRILPFHLFLWPEGIIVVPDYWMLLWCRNLCSLDLFSPFRSTQIQGLDSHSDLPPCPLPLSFPSSCCYFCLLPLSPIFLFSPLLFSFPILPSSCIHLLSQGPCGTLRGGWGWWWCRWWWNSHSVSFVPSPTARSPFPLVSPSHPFLPHFGNKMQWEWEGRQGGRLLPVFAGFIHASQCKHTPPSRRSSHPCLCWYCLVFKFINY